MKLYQNNKTGIHTPSKLKPISIIRKAKLQWIGLYNMKKQKLEFVGNDFLLIKENGGKFLLILELCH
ncbi:hypothetical protein J2Y40_003951 [Chryseobacterium sp. 2987]|nr:hypothetical protein [Chryseobacterium sp. 2987]